MRFEVPWVSSRRMNALSTELCVLEPQLEAHASAMFEVLSDPAIYEFEGMPPPSVEQLAAGFRRKEARVSPDGREGWLNWVARLANGELAGYVQATVLPTGVALVGYEFASRHWRRGIGSASVKAVLAELARSYEVHTAVAVLKTANHRSMGLLLQPGFQRASEEDAQTHEAQADETVLVKRLASPGH
jgi:RimJ/RimL family protein N-acetyltransferase